MTDTFLRHAIRVKASLTLAALPGRMTHEPLCRAWYSFRQQYD